MGISKNRKIGLVYLGRKGGGATYSYEMAQAFIEKGLEIFAVIAKDIENRDRWENLFQNNGMRIVFLPTYSSKFGFLKSFLPNREYMRCVYDLKSWGLDVIYIPMLSLNARKIIKHFKGIDIVTTVHDLYPHPGEQNPIQYNIFEQIKKKSTKFIVLTKSFRNKVAQMYNVSQERVCFIPHAGFCFNKNGDLPNFSTIKNTILFFGRITPYKGLGILLKAMEHVKETLPSLRLVIAGNGDITSSEKDLIRQNANVTFINDWISEDKIVRLFAESDMTILPYVEASQSGVAAASFSAGRSVIASNVGGLKEQVEAGGGLIVDPGNIIELANAITNCYKHPNTIRERNRRAYEYFKTELTWSASASKLIEFL